MTMRCIVGIALVTISLSCLVASAQPASDVSDHPRVNVDAAEFDVIEELLQPVGLPRGDSGASRRFYVAPILGASWGTFDYPGQPQFQNEHSESLTAGAAVGIAIAGLRGQWRIEAEGRYRDGIRNDFGQESTDNWSALCNVWRDVSVTNKLGLYGGGGVGAGGFRWFSDVVYPGQSIIANDQLTTFAWQAGGGMIYSLSERITLDLGYRFYSMNEVTSYIPSNDGEYAAQFSANELLFQVRIYEPFRGWTSDRR